MNKIIIDPHYCSKEEYEELINYLNDNSWDWKEEVPKLRFDTPERGVSEKMLSARKPATAKAMMEPR